MLDDGSWHLAAAHGASVNQQGSFYIRGEAYDFTKKLEVAAAYIAARDANGGNRPIISGLQDTCRVSRSFIRKVETELNVYGRVLRPSEIQQNREGPVGPGSRSLDEIDGAVLLFLYLQEPSRTLRNYTQFLEELTGTIVSESTVCRWFLYAFPFRGGLCRPNLVPFDKFRPDNIQRALDYIEVIATIAPERIKVGDEKHLKGDSIMRRKTRRHPIEGYVPEVIVTPDFRNRYHLTGFCSINPQTTDSAVWCSLHEVINDAEQFAIELEYAIHDRFLRGGDVLVLDNATVHTGGINSVLEDYMWEQYGIFVLFLPARAPEWNPQEQVWNLLERKLKQLSLRVCRAAGKHATAHAAIDILESVTYDEVRQMYVHAGVLRR